MSRTSCSLASSRLPVLEDEKAGVAGRAGARGRGKKKEAFSMLLPDLEAQPASAAARAAARAAVDNLA